MKKKIPKKYKENIETLKYLMRNSLSYPPYLILDIVKKLNKRFGKNEIGVLVKIEKIEYTR